MVGTQEETKGENDHGLFVMSKFSNGQQGLIIVKDYLTPNSKEDMELADVPFNESTKPTAVALS